MNEPNKFRRPKARLKAANSTEAPTEQASKSASSMKSNYELQIKVLQLENKIEKLEDKLLEKEDRITELVVENTELRDELDEIEDADQLAEQPELNNPLKGLADLAPMVIEYLNKQQSNKDREYELSVLVAKQAAERIAMQKAQGYGNGEI
jgi:hypothetical protein